MNNFETNEMGSVAEKNLQVIYETIFLEVFPMEKLT
jgi:hypothetical protein